MSVLLIDVGNTRLKWCLDGVAESASGAAAHPLDASDYDSDYGYLLNVCQEISRAQKSPVERILVASVKHDAFNEALEKAVCDVQGQAPLFIQVAAHIGGFACAYDNPERLGVDRWLAMLGCFATTPNLDFCVVDFGTAVKLDWVAAGGQHQGGMITLGLRGSVDALLSKTDRIYTQTAGVEGANLGFGRNTEAAVHNGALFALVALVERAAQRLNDLSVGPSRLVLTGGNARQVSENLAVPHQIESNLVYEGMRWLMRHGV